VAAAEAGSNVKRRDAVVVLPLFRVRFKQIIII